MDGRVGRGGSGDLSGCEGRAARVGTQRLRHEHVPNRRAAVDVGVGAVVDDVDAAISGCIDPGKEREFLRSALVDLDRRAPAGTKVGGVAEERPGVDWGLAAIDRAPYRVDVARVVDG